MNGKDCLGLGDPFLFFVQLSHSVIKVARVSQDSLTFLSFPSHSVPKNACLVVVFWVFILLHTVKSFSSIGKYHIP